VSWRPLGTSPRSLTTEDGRIIGILRVVRKGYFPGAPQAPAKTVRNARRKKRFTDPEQREGVAAVADLSARRSPPRA